MQLTESVTSVAGVRGLAPGLRDLVATAAAKVLRRVRWRAGRCRRGSRSDGVKVRIDAHLDDTRSVAEIVDEIFSVIAADLAAKPRKPTELDIDLRVVSRSLPRSRATLMKGAARTQVNMRLTSDAAGLSDSDQAALAFLTIFW